MGSCHRWSALKRAKILAHKWWCRLLPLTERCAGTSPRPRSRNRPRPRSRSRARGAGPAHATPATIGRPVPTQPTTGCVLRSKTTFSNVNQESRRHFSKYREKTPRLLAGARMRRLDAVPSPHPHRNSRNTTTDNARRVITGTPRQLKAILRVFSRHLAF